jgi:hypothetical protein
MPNNLNGSIGIRWGIEGVTSTAFGNAYLDSLSFERDGETFIVKDQAGITKLRYNFDKKTKLRASYTVYGASANTSASMSYPDTGVSFTLSDTLNQVTGSFVTDTSGPTMTNTNAVKIDITATAYDSGIS